MSIPISPAQTEALILDRSRDPLLIVKLNRPAVHNALDHPLIIALCQVLKEAAVDPVVRAIVLTGTGPTFCSGDDLKVLRTETAEAFGDTIGALQDLTATLFRSPKPIVAALNGPAYGAGLELVLACDARVATESFAAATPEVHLGLVATNAASILLPHLIGPSAARIMLLSGKRQSASWCLERGLVDRIVTKESLLEHAIELAQELSTGAPGAVAATRHMLNAALGTALYDALQRENRTCIEARASDECAEGIDAHFAGRRPNWVGK